MVTNREIKTVVDEILESKEFRDSPVYKNLLSYLVNATLSNNIPKEITIAIDVFGKDASFNTNKDSSVRYHIHILRKKLNDYYKNEGQLADIKLMIPVGHYEIKFIQQQEQSAPEVNRIIAFFKRGEIIVIFILLAMVSYLIYLQFLKHQSTSTATAFNAVASSDKIWDSFFKNGYPISIILGDDFLLDEYSVEFKRYRQIRDWKINSENDLANFLIQYPKADLWKSEITDIPFGGADNLMDMLPIIYQFQRKVTLRMASTISLDELRNQNIIYIGEFKNLRVLNKLIYKTPIRFQYHPDERLFLVNEKGDTMNTYIRIEAPYEQLNKYNVDYSLLIKIPGFTNENFMFLVGFGYGGRLERTKMLADPALRRQFIVDIQRLNQTVPEYFIALFEVKSIERTGFTNEIKYFQEIAPNFFDGQ